MRAPLWSPRPGRRLAAAVAVVLALGACGLDVTVEQGPRHESNDAPPTTAPGTADHGASDPGTSDPDTTDPIDSAPPTSGPADPSNPADPSSAFTPAPILWEPYRGSVELGLLDVPIDYADPAGGTIELFLARHLARDPGQRIGTLLVNPGGPGFGGADYAIFAAQLYDDALLDRFDIIGWDPRGTGQSDPAIDCIDDYDRYFASIDTASDPEAEAEVLARDFVAGCEARSGDIWMHVGTNNSARDIDVIRRALGEPTISYLGFSYGSELGAVWATLFPAGVRAAVLDGAADPTADSLEGSLQQMAGFDASLGRFLERCASDPSCAFHNDGNAEAAFEALFADLAENAIPSEAGRPPVGRNVATTAAVVAMYNEAYWPQLERALEAASRGDGAGLLRLHDTYYQRQPDGTWGNELEAFQVISCADTPDRPTPADVAAELPRYLEAAPRLFWEDGPPGYFCTFFPPASDPRIEVTGAGAGPILVVGTTGDPATPLESTRAMARTLDEGVLLVVDSNDHGGYFASACARRIIGDYLMDLAVPADGTECA